MLRKKLFSIGLTAVAIFTCSHHASAQWADFISGPGYSAMRRPGYRAVHDALSGTTVVRTHAI